MITNSPGIQGLKQRTDLAKHLISTVIEGDTSDDEDTYAILDIGSGSGTYGFHALGKLQAEEGHLTNLDLDALQISKDLGKKSGLNSNIDYVNEEAVSYLNRTRRRFNLVVSIGILDFMADDQAIHFLDKVGKQLRRGNYLITSATDSYRFIGFTRLAGMEDLTPRTEEDFSNLLAEAGYTDLEVVTDRSGTQHVARARVK
ncbi:MAG: class I SAM-dependent methyltransferase [Candidatus Acetothermia bacterium]